MKFRFFVVFFLCNIFFVTNFNYAKKVKNEVDLDPTPYMLPHDHWLRPTLNRTFSNPNVLTNADTLRESGYITVCVRPGSSLRVVHHPDVKGYLYKVNIDSDCKGKRRDCNNKLVQRCITAQLIRDLIRTHNIRYFTVPQKWIYEPTWSGKDGKAVSYVLIVEDMHTKTRAESYKAWKEIATKRHVEELFIILSNGYASLAISQNIPYKENGVFACIDTEYPKRNFDLKRLSKRLPKNKRLFWRKLVRSQKPKKEQVSQ